MVQITSDQAGASVWKREEEVLLEASEEAGLRSLKPRGGCRGVRQVGMSLLESGSHGCCTLPPYDKLKPWRV